MPALLRVRWLSQKNVTTAVLYNEPTVDKIGYFNKSTCHRYQRLKHCVSMAARANILASGVIITSICPAAISAMQLERFGTLDYRKCTEARLNIVACMHGSVRS